MTSTSGQIELVSHMASDLMVVNAARVSFGKLSQEMTPADEGLISFLMRERHGTPFEHNAFTFVVSAPVFVAREWFRHRIGSFNELSARYSEIPDEYWTPTVDDMRKQVGKPGQYSFEPIDEQTAEWASNMISSAQRAAFNVYDRLLESGLAKEVARSVLPVGMMTRFYWTVNARSLMNFLSLRTSLHAQKEIREIALVAEQLFADVMPITYRAWVANGKTAP